MSIVCKINKNRRIRTRNMHMSQLPHSNQHFKSNIQTICVIELVNNLINPL